MLSEITKNFKEAVILLRKELLKYLYLSGYKTWPTKSYEVWLFIQFLLYKSKSKTILELGSGRSTHYFAEYCQKSSGELISIEQNKVYLNKNKKGLKKSYLQINGLYHVPISGDWFDVNILKEIISNKIIDFVLIDAPGGGGKGIRNSDVGNDFLKLATNKATIIAVDDFHRKEVKSSVNSFLLERKVDFVPFLFTYPVGSNHQHNEILFFVRSHLFESCLAAIKLFEFHNVLKNFNSSTFDNLTLKKKINYLWQEVLNN